MAVYRRIDSIGENDKRAKLPDLEFEGNTLRIVIGDTIRDTVRYIDNNESEYNKKLFLNRVYNILNGHLEKQLNVKTFANLSKRRRYAIVGHIAFCLNRLESNSILDTNEAMANAVAYSLD